MKINNQPATSNAPLFWLALGTFAVGAEGFMIAGILPSIAQDLAVSVSACGQLVAAFAFAYAISSPILTALSGSINRRKLLIFAMGVPLGTLVATKLGWRMTFAGLALVAAVATAALWFGLPKDIGAGLTSASLRERIQVAGQPAVLLALPGTSLWAMGSYTLYTYLALLVEQATMLHGAQIGFILFTWGVSAAIGVAVGGKGSDKRGFRSVIVPARVR